MRTARAAGRPGVFLDDQPQPQVLRPRRDRRRIRPQAAPQRNARLREVRQALGARAPLPRRGARRARDHGHELQPARAVLLPRTRHRRQLPPPLRARVKLAGVRAVLFDLDGTFADTAPDLARALNRVRAEDGLAPLPAAVARPHTSSGARGLPKAGFDISPEDGRDRALGARFLDFYEEELC